MGGAALWLLAFPREKQPEFPVHCIGTRKVIKSNLIKSNTGVNGCLQPEQEKEEEGAKVVSVRPPLSGIPYVIVSESYFPS